MNSISKQYQLDEQHRTQTQRQATQDHLAQIANVSRGRQLPALPHIGRRLWLAIAIIILVGVAAFVTPTGAKAQDLLDPGQGDPLGQVMVAYRVGSFYFETGDYQKAAEKFTEAIELTPIEVFQQLPEYSVLYWALVDAQLELGDTAGAWDSYQSYLEVAGENADGLFTAYVQELEISIAAGFEEGASS